MSSLTRIGLLSSITIIALLIAGEFTLRIRGSQPYIAYPVNIKAEPKQYFELDSLLGYKHRPGKIEVTLKERYTFTTTHNDLGLRITHAENQSLDSLPKIWLFGCSFTYGWSVNDQESYPWLLQSKLDDYDVINWGCNGYGTLHFYLQLKHALQYNPKPKMVIVTYAGFHQRRNTFSYARRRSVRNWSHLGELTQPYAIIDEQGELAIKQTEKTVYPLWPLAEKSSFVYFLQRNLEDLKDRQANHEEITRQLMLEINQLCKQNDLPLLIANINDREEFQFLEELARQHDFWVADISVDLTNKENNNKPFDTHPSAKAHRHFANKLLKEIKTATP